MNSGKVILIIQDGWGIADNPAVSAIQSAKTTFYDNALLEQSSCKLEASGLAVGLPEGQMGNSTDFFFMVFAEVGGRCLILGQGLFPKIDSSGQLSENHEIHLIQKGIFQWRNIVQQMIRGDWYDIGK